MDKFVIVLVCYLIGMIVGYALAHILTLRKRDGLFILDDSDPNTTRWILDVKIDPDEIKNKKEIRLKVCKMDDQEDV